MISWGIAAVLALALGIAPPPASRPSPTPPTASTVAALTLNDYLRAYMGAEVRWRVAALAASVAHLAVERSTDRTTLNLEAAPGARYDGFIFGTGAPSRDLGSLFVSRLSARLGDPLGGTLDVDVSGTRLTRPALSAGGHQIRGTIAYALPLLRNALGRLYRLETRALELADRARATEAEAVRIERCAAGMDLYVAAWSLQEQGHIWQQLMLLKEQTFSRTRRDYGRRMISKLDYLAAQSDWLAAQQRGARLDGDRCRALVSLRSYLPAAAETGSLASPLETIDGLALPESAAAATALIAEHPVVRAAHLVAGSLSARARMTDASRGAEVAIVPQVGVDYASRLFQPPGANAALTDVSALLSFVVTLPVIDPSPRYDIMVLHDQVRQEHLRSKEAVRSLGERAALALQAIATAAAQLEITDEKERVLADELKEAGAYFSRGRLEFQDYLQHWALYENARFEHLDLDVARTLARIELLRVTAPALPACRGAAP